MNFFSSSPMSMSPASFVHGAAQDGVCHAVEVIFRLFAADGVADIHEEAAVFKDVAAEPRKSPPARFRGRAAAEAALHSRQIHSTKVVNVAEVVIEGHGFMPQPSVMSAMETFESGLVRSRALSESARAFFVLGASHTLSLE